MNINKRIPLKLYRLHKKWFSVPPGPQDGRRQGRAQPPTQGPLAPAPLSRASRPFRAPDPKIRFDYPGSPSAIRETSGSVGMSSSRDSYSSPPRPVQVPFKGPCSTTFRAFTVPKEDRVSSPRKAFLTVRFLGRLVRLHEAGHRTRRRKTTSLDRVETTRDPTPTPPHFSYEISSRTPGAVRP